MEFNVQSLFYLCLVASTSQTVPKLNIQDFYVFMSPMKGKAPKDVRYVIQKCVQIDGTVLAVFLWKTSIKQSSRYHLVDFIFDCNCGTCSRIAVWECKSGLLHLGYYISCCLLYVRFGRLCLLWLASELFEIRRLQNRQSIELEIAGAGNKS